MKALTSFGQSILHRRKFEGKNVYVGTRKISFLNGFGEKWGMERGGDDCCFGASGSKKDGHVYGGYDMAMSHEGEEEYVKLIMGFAFHLTSAS